MEPNSYQQDLEEALAIKREANPHYSMRAFARDCGVSPGFLANVLKGRKKLSEDRARAIAERLFQSDNKKRSFVAKVRMSLSKNQHQVREIESTLEALNDPSDVRVVDEDKYEIVSDWLYGFITEYSKVEALSHDELGKIADRLGLSKQAVEMAVNRLVKMDLLQKDDQGILKATHKHVHLPSLPSQALIKFHQQILGKADWALQNLPRDRRYFEGSILALDEESMQKLQQRIEELQNFAMYLSEKSIHPDRVVQLNTQMFCHMQRSENLD